MTLRPWGMRIEVPDPLEYPDNEPANPDDDREAGEATCPECGADWLRWIEDMASIRQVIGWRGGKLHVNSVIDDHDYDGAHGGHLECGECGYAFSYPEDEIEWD